MVPFSFTKKSPASSLAISEAALLILKVAANANGNIAVFNQPDLKFVDAGVNSPSHRRFQGETPRESASYVDAVDELENADLAVFEEGALWRVTTKGFEVADTLPDLPIQASPPAEETQPPELNVDRKLIEEMGVESWLEQNEKRMVWVRPEKKERYLLFDDFQMILWEDSDEKKWQLAAMPDGDLPLETSFTREEIKDRREKRKQKT